MQSVNQQIDRIFSRQTLGSILLGLTSGKVVEKIIALLAPTVRGKLIAWSISAVLATLLFIFWDHLEQRAEKTAENVNEKVEKTSEKVEETSEKVGEKVEKTVSDEE